MRGHGEKMKMTIQEWIRQANEFFKSLVFNDSEDIYFVKESGGYKAYLRDKPKSASSAISAPSNAGISIIEIKLKIDDTTYLADVYGSGIDADPTEEDVTVKVLNIATGETIPSTWFFANQQTWGTGESQETYYTIDIPRWL